MGCNIAEGNIQNAKRALALFKRMQESELFTWAATLFNRMRFLTWLKAT
jgi:hypothetical protein